MKLNMWGQPHIYRLSTIENPQYKVQALIFVFVLYFNTPTTIILSPHKAMSIHITFNRL